jgi:hypothetical protein
MFNGVMIPIFDLEEASFKDAINVLAKAVESQSKGAVIPNFIIQDKSNHFDGNKVTLKLKNIPAGEVLDYLLRSAGASVSFGKYTTVIRPRGNVVEEKTNKGESKEE